MKKIVIFGGGKGLSQILKGLKLFPLDITAVVSVSDNGTSTGKLREEMNIPAVGDISKVLLSMSSTDNDILNLLNYRFNKSTSMAQHSIKNLILAALIDIKGNLSDAVLTFSKLFNIKGKVLPITEDNVDLIGKTENNEFIVGEKEITENSSKIVKLFYDKKFKINKEVVKAVNESDLIIFSPGSLLTSVLPHIICKEMVKILKQAKKPIIYISNLVTQPGETDNFNVSDHVKMINKYLWKNAVNVVIANNTPIEKNIALKYKTVEQKDPVFLDKKNLEKLNVKIIEDKLFLIEENVIRHDSLKTAYLIFSYLMDGNYDIYN